MLRVLALTATLAVGMMLSGCLDDAPGAGDPVSEARFEVKTLEGRFLSYGAAGVQENEGGEHRLEVPTPWRNVHVGLEANIEVFLVLTPVECPDASADCSIRLEPDEGEVDGSWLLPMMEAGAWDVSVHQDGYTVVEGDYRISFDYLV